MLQTHAASGLSAGVFSWWGWSEGRGPSSNSTQQLSQGTGSRENEGGRKNKEKEEKRERIKWKKEQNGRRRTGPRVSGQPLKSPLLDLGPKFPSSEAISSASWCNRHAMTQTQCQGGHTRAPSMPGWVQGLLKEQHNGFFFYNTGSNTAHFFQNGTNCHKQRTVCVKNMIIFCFAERSWEIDLPLRVSVHNITWR